MQYLICTNHYSELIAYARKTMISIWIFKSLYRSHALHIWHMVSKSNYDMYKSASSINPSLIHQENTAYCSLQHCIFPIKSWILSLTLVARLLLFQWIWHHVSVHLNLVFSTKWHCNTTTAAEEHRIVYISNRVIRGLGCFIPIWFLCLLVHAFKRPDIINISHTDGSFIRHVFLLTVFKQCII